MFFQVPMKAWTFLFAILIVALAKDDNRLDCELGDIANFSKVKFDEWQKNNFRILLFFVTDKAKSKEYVQTAKKIASLMSVPLPRPLKEAYELHELPVVVSIVDCSLEKEFCKEHEIEKVPSVRFFSYFILRLEET